MNAGPKCYCMRYFRHKNVNFKKVSLVKGKDNVLGILKMSLNQKTVKYFRRNTHSNLTQRCSKFRNVYDLNLLDIMHYFQLENVNFKKSV
jgi:hypothetical protein